MHQRIPEIGPLLDEIVRINPLQSSFIQTSLDGATPEEIQAMAKYVRYCLDNSIELPYLAQCYDVIVKDTLREQMYFQRHKRYRYSTFAEVADAVYYDDEYMSKYMHGLALTAWLWPNHREMHRYFESVVPRQSTGAYLEIGPGHGVYMMTAMNTCSYDRFEGIDLSPTSVEMTRSLLNAQATTEKAVYDIYCSDFLEDQLKQDDYSAVVMGEVLEHVEQPALFLDKIRQIVTDDAFIFITTPMNAPAIDHIYLFESLQEIEQLVEQAGLVIRDSRLVAYPGLSVEESTEQALPVNVALVLGKQ